MKYTDTMTSLQRLDWVKCLADRHPVIGIMILSLTIKLLLFGFDQVVNPDGALYIATAQQMAKGNMAEALRLYPMPAYPLLLTLAHFVISDWVAAGRIIGITALVLASVPLYGITHMLLNRQAAFWAALCFSFTPDANGQALMVIRDPVFLLTVLTAVFFFLKGMRQQSLNLMVVSLLLTGLCFLFRVEGVVFAVTPVLFLTSKAFLAKSEKLKQFIRKSLLIWIGIPFFLFVLTASILGPQLIGQNRVGELLTEVKKVAQFKAFENYQKIYNFFKVIEADPPFSGLSKSLPALVRHWMPLIYLIGLLEYFVKQIFWLFLLPLLFSGHHFFSSGDRKITIDKQFVFLTWLVYMLLVLYIFIVRDFIQGRFLFTPAVLLYPWVGYGVTLVLGWIKDIRFAHFLQLAVVLSLITIPCVKSVRAVVNSDLGALDVGRYIIEDKSLADAKMLFSDTRQWLYGKRTESFHNVYHNAWIISKYIEKGQVKAIEKQAINENAEAIVLFVNFNKTKTIPEFDRYRVYKQFPSRKGVTIIYIAE